MKKIENMTYEELIEERKELEKFIINLIVKNNKENVKIHKILRGQDKRMLSFSPFSVNKFTSIYITDILRWRYHQLSEEIHKYYDGRAKIQNKIEEIYGYPIKDKYIHLFFEDVFKDYNTYKKYCNKNNKKIVKIEKFNRICNLIKKWRKLSADIHYKMTLSEKRKLKKIFEHSNK
jgi:hypothetical protein